MAPGDGGCSCSEVGSQEFAQFARPLQRTETFSSILLQEVRFGQEQDLACASQIDTLMDLRFCVLGNPVGIQRSLGYPCAQGGPSNLVGDVNNCQKQCKQTHCNNSEYKKLLPPPKMEIRGTPGNPKDHMGLEPEGTIV